MDQNVPALRGVIEDLNFGIIVSSQSKIRLINRHALGVLGKKFLSLKGERLRCADRKFQPVLDKAILDAKNGEAPTVYVSDRHSDIDYAVQVFVPDVRPEEESDEPCLAYKIFTIRTPTTASSDTVDQIAAAYQLSKGERGVIHAALAMISLNEYAEEKGIKLDTARKQLKSALSKMKIRSQKQLFQLYEKFELISVMADAAE